MGKIGCMFERQGEGSGRREAGQVMLFIKRTKNEYLPDSRDYKKNDGIPTCGEYLSVNSEYCSIAVYFYENFMRTWLRME